MDTDGLFGPLNKEYCIWFYFLSVFGFVLLCLLLISGIGLILFSKTKRGSGFYMSLLTGALTYAVIYFQNRLLYSMCTNA